MKMGDMSRKREGSRGSKGNKGNEGALVYRNKVESES